MVREDAYSENVVSMAARDALRPRHIIRFPHSTLLTGFCMRSTEPVSQTQRATAICELTFTGA